MTGMLASVNCLEEAWIVAEAGVDIIDLKAPAAGSLGALPTAVVRAIVAELGQTRTLSATIGDLPMDPAVVLRAAQTMAATRVDFVKIGFFPGGDWSGSIRSLAALATQGTRLVAVFFGDQQPDARWIAELAKANFAGAMLDTLDKRNGSLPEVCPAHILQEFIAATKTHGLLCGLAGSLRAGDIPALLALRPDYLGFRGALCPRHRRTSAIDAEAVRAIRAAISTAATRSSNAR